MFGWSVILPLFFGNGLKSFEGGNSKQSNGMMLSFDVGQVLRRVIKWYLTRNPGYKPTQVNGYKEYKVMTPT
ncbi:unnamed protein product [Bursaphelenchus xylophilus]|uniref:(pine wood nematode) hypothetical protein n=1 Tax=Bursaphelenchus xylophilus TaxID=6326 RepID=A0A7I8XPV2_BURXY|nr:unnamed protein product [Bursaphelenchus xylophilus]CAG9087450.1 unnamed protein product [Bursaphelenchus xylophilus]